jgi:hypothetical protein
MRSVRALLLFLAVSSLPIAAGQIAGSATGLASPAYTITFEEYPIVQNTPITTQYASLGASFSSGIYYDPQPGFFPDHSLGNFAFVDDVVQTTPVFISFTSPQTDAALQLITNPGTTTFTAMLGANTVDSFSASTSLAILYYGFTGELFDSIRIDVGGDDNATLFDNLELGGAAVPEPGTVGLLGVGLVGLAFVRKRLASR